eukprot:COSAG02_NODE_19602_length_873_cov_3.127907_1_plen_30_part_10
MNRPGSGSIRLPTSFPRPLALKLSLDPATA